MTGRKRFLLVDTQGLPPEVLVGPASVQDQAGGRGLALAGKTRPSCVGLKNVWADGGYDGVPFRDGVKGRCGCESEVVADPAGRRGFFVLPRR